MQLLFIFDNVVTLISFCGFFLLLHWYNLYHYAITGGTTNYPQKYHHSPQWLYYHICEQHFWVSIVFGIIGWILGIYIFKENQRGQGLFTVCVIFSSIAVYMVARSYFSPMKEPDRSEKIQKSPK